MLTEGLYKFSELSRLIQESNEFKPVIGKNVIKDDAKNNVKAVDDIMKDTGKMKGESVEEPKKTNPEDAKDYNKTTLDVNFTTKPSKEYEERVKAQVHGFPSKDNEENSKIEDENESLDFEGNKEFYKNQSENHKEVSDKETDEKHAGLKSRELPKELFKNNSLFTENRKMKRLHFKNTVFLSEEKMLKKVPDDYKKDGNKFIMKDANGTEYMVECKVDDKFGFAKINVLGRYNKKESEEQLKRMQSLYEYNSKDFTNTLTSEVRGTENRHMVSEMISRVKDIKNNK